MLHTLWTGIMILSIVCGLINQRGQEVTAALLNGGYAALTFMVTLGGSMCLWSGLLRVADKAGFTRFFSRIIAPVMRRLFPGLCLNGKAGQAISMNLAANFLGLGNAATPLGLRAMKELQKENPFPAKASRDMIVFAVLNTASVQFLPTTIAALRSEAGSSSPLSILPAVWITSLGAAIMAVVVAGTFAKKRR